MHLFSMDLFRGLMLVIALALPASGQFASFSRTKPNTTARLMLSHDEARPGETITAAVELTMAPGWHTYWQNPGESGGATEIQWTLPPGITAGVVQWPVPEKLVQEGMVTYVYHGTATLLVPLTIGSDTKPGRVELDGLVKWLECEKVCVPASGEVSAVLTVGTESRLSAATQAVAQASTNLPAQMAPGTAAARWDQPPNADKRAFVIEWNTDSAVGVDFYPFASPLVTVSPATDVLSTNGGKVVLRKTAEKTEKDWPEKIEGLLVRNEGGTMKGYQVALALEKGAAVTDSSAPASSKPFWMWLVYAFIGGLILNIMPCVLPVIALKILGFVGQSREHPARVRVLGFVYTLGVLASFLVLAGIVVAVKAAGQKAGWGMQFSNPQFIVVLTAIVTLVALNLFGVFEVTLSGRAMSAASGAAGQHGAAGAFMNGVLATVLATPCTAPFLGAALGFAFAQPAAVIVLFFVTIGLGLALPYLILSWNPRLLKFLPKPGLWMERFKVAMGFPLIATAIWLFTLTEDHYGDRSWWLGVYLVTLSLAAWIFGTFVQRGVARRGLAIAIILLLVLGGYAYAIERELDWRNPVQESAEGNGIIQHSPDGISWRRWSPEAVDKARAAGHPVFVDFTAKWCVTCQVNKKTSIEIASVRNKLKEINAVALLGDHTKYPPAITAELEKFNRAGVPLVLVYPRDQSKPPIVLPEVLTPGIVLDALEAAK